MRVRTFSANSPLAEPVSIDEVKRYLSVDPDVTGDDLFFADIIREARSHAEDYLGQVISSRTMILRADFVEPGELTLPLLGPVIEIASVKSMNAGDDGDPLYELWDGHITIYDIPEAHDRVRVTYTAGMCAVPESLKLALKKMCLTLYKRTGELMTEEVRSLLGVQVNV